MAIHACFRTPGPTYFQDTEWKKTKSEGGQDMIWGGWPWMDHGWRRCTKSRWTRVHYEWGGCLDWLKWMDVSSPRRGVGRLKSTVTGRSNPSLLHNLVVPNSSTTARVDCNPSTTAWVDRKAGAEGLVCTMAGVEWLVWTRAGVEGSGSNPCTPALVVLNPSTPAVAILPPLPEWTPGLLWDFSDFVFFLLCILSHCWRTLSFFAFLLVSYSLCHGGKFARFSERPNIPLNCNSTQAN